MTQLSENARELTKLLAAECCSTQDVATLLKSLFAGTIEEMLEAEMAEHLGYRLVDYSIYTERKTLPEKNTLP